MPGLMISAAEIRAAPSGVRVWLQQQGFWVFRESPSPDPLPTDPVSSPTQKRVVPEQQADTTKDREAAVPPAPVPDNNLRPPAIIEADARNAALHKLIAERAYEIWENQGRPHGCDLMHWLQAEQEIIACIQRPVARRSQCQPPARARRRSVNGHADSVAR